VTQVTVNVEIFVTVTIQHATIDAHVTTNVHGDVLAVSINAIHFVKIPLISHTTKHVLINVLNWVILLLANVLAMLLKKTATNLETRFLLNAWKTALAMTNVQLVNMACVHHSAHHLILKNAKFFGNMKTINVSRIVTIHVLNFLMIAKLVATANQSALMSAS